MRARALFTFVLMLSSVAAFAAPVSAEDPPTVEPTPTPPDYFVENLTGVLLPLSSAATRLNLSNDEVTSAIPLGFTTRFFGTRTSEFWVGSNGFVTLHFLTPPGCCDGAVLGTAGGPDGMVAGFWTDLNPAAGGSIRFDRQVIGNQSALVVDYANVPVVNGSTTASFQVVVMRDGVIEVRIANATAPAGRTVTIGLESLNASRAVPILHASAVSLHDVGFRFTPNVPPSPPPVIVAVSPTVVAPGGFARVIGENFSPDATVTVAGVVASSLFESTTTLAFFVPSFLSPGFASVGVENPDGNASILVDALQITESFALTQVAPHVARQGDTIMVFGSGFGADTVVLLDEELVEATPFGSGAFQVTLAKSFRPGVYDVSVFDPAHGRQTMKDALVVKGRPDLLIDSLTLQRPAYTLPLLGAFDQAETWRVEVRVRNAGDATAADPELALAYRTGSGPLAAAGGHEEESTEPLPDLAPGETWTFQTHVGAVNDLGDVEVVALVTSGGVGDRDGANNQARATSSAYVGGFGGARLDGCATAERACMGPEAREHRAQTRNQTDRHVNATLRIDARMDQPEFTFNNFILQFTTFTPHAGGGFTDCITWRFVGAPEGLLSVRMRAGNGLDGVAQIPAADARQSAGSTQDENWTDLRAFDVILWETERATSPPRASDPLDTYAFSDEPRAEWFLNATGLVGDFTHCSIREADGSGHEEFVFAELPDDLQALVPSTTGFGQAAEVLVRFAGMVDEQTSQPVTTFLGGA